MKVKLSYSIEVDEVPNEINRLLEKARGMLSDIQGDLSQSKYMPGAGVKLIEDLDGVRKDMLNLDVELENAINIVLGYSQIILEQHTQAHTPQAPPTAPAGENAGE